MSNFNQGVPGVATLINSSAVILSGNAASANALTVRQFGGGNVFSAQTTTGSTALFVGANGNVGVGTANPYGILHVDSGSAASNIATAQPMASGALIAGAPTGGTGTAGEYSPLLQFRQRWFTTTDTVATGGISGRKDTGSGGYGGGLQFWYAPYGSQTLSPGMALDQNGRVGIGTTSPGTALQVNGDQISVPSYITSPGTPYTTSQQFYFAFNGNLTDSQSGVTATATGASGGYMNSAIRFNKAYYFTFPNSRVTSTVSQTVAFWFCPLEQSNQTVFSWGDGAQNVSMNMDLSASQNRFNIYIATPTAWIVSALGSNAPQYKLGTWIHVALVVSTTSATLYFNGVQVDQQTGSYTSASSTLMTTAYVGANGDYQARKFNGLLDELRIYNTSLSPTQVLTLYNSTTFIANGMSGGSVLTNSIGVGVQTPLNSIDAAGSVALGSYAGANQAPNGGLICSGNVGIGTTSPGAQLTVQNSVNQVGALNTFQCLSYSGAQFVIAQDPGNANLNSGWNGAQLACLFVGKATGSGRSISAAGTLNASGADYAEYMTKTSDFTIKKGDVIGVNAQGLLTNVFRESVTFIVKSTDPCMVGGDTWGTEEALGLTKPKDTPETDPGYAEYQTALSQFNAKLEEARARVDRIAFAGQVPVNVLGATPGQYIIPMANDDGSISGQAVSSPTMDQYMAAVGKVIKVLPDGRAQIIVKVV
jgi:hypothetical protein